MIASAAARTQAYHPSASIYITAASIVIIVIPDTRRCTYLLIAMDKTKHSTTDLTSSRIMSPTGRQLLDAKWFCILKG